MTAIPILNDDLHVFIPNDSEMTRSIDLFVQFYSLQKKLNAEYWLLDVSGFESMNDIRGSLQKLKLDLDDDLYLYNYDRQQKVVNILEFYEIHSSVKRKLINYGSWNSINGLNVITIEKWNRRKNLEVSTCHRIYFGIFFWCKIEINKYIPHLGSNVKYHCIALETFCYKSATQDRKKSGI